MEISNERLTMRAAGLTLLTAILWGGNSVSIKIALDGMPPVALAAVRFAIGGLVVLLCALFSGIPVGMSGNDRRGLGTLAVLFLAQIFLLNAGTHHTLASRSTLMISTYPFFTALFAHLFIPGDRLTAIKVAGMALSLAGVTVMLADALDMDDASYMLGDLMVLGSGILLGARQVYTKRLTQNIHPYKLLVWQAGLSLPLFGILSVLLERDVNYHLTAPVMGAIAYQGLVVAGFCFILFVSLLRRYSASRLGVFGFFTPVFGVLASDVLLGDALSPQLLTSMLFVGAGIAVVNWRP